MREEWGGKPVMRKGGSMVAELSSAGLALSRASRGGYLLAEFALSTLAGGKVGRLTLRADDAYWRLLP